MEQQIRTLLQEALTEYPLPDVIEADFDLIDQGGVDSLGMLSLASAVQKRFGVVVLDHEWSLLRSVRAIQQFIQERCAVTPQAA